MAQEETGHFRCYIPKKFNDESLRLLDIANAVIRDYESQDFVLTLRQLYYQLVTKNIFPNTAQSYNKLKGLISDGRLAGLVSWTAIEDRGRNLRGLGYQTSPAEAIRTVAAGYRRDLWAGQDFRPEVWIEKEALVGVIEQICHRLRVDFYACKGYDSQSQSWRAGRRFANYTRRGQRPIVFHLGDHDPSGIDMTRDNRDRLTMFAGTPVIVQRLALNRPQIDQYGPPPNPAKLTDSRAEAYIAEHGQSSWELDALSPKVISDLIEGAIVKIRDPERWDAAIAEEADDRRRLDEMIELAGGGSTGGGIPDFDS